MEVSLSVCSSYYMETAMAEKEAQGFSICRPSVIKAGCSFTIKASVTNKVTRQKQELPESSIFHKIVFSFSTFIHVTSRQPCCAGFSSEAGRELQDFTFSATAASKSPLRTQSPALIPLPHS